MASQRTGRDLARERVGGQVAGPEAGDVLHLARGRGRPHAPSRAVGADHRLLLDLAAVESHEPGHGVRRHEGAGIGTQVEPCAARVTRHEPIQPVARAPARRDRSSERASTRASPAGVSSVTPSAGANVHWPGGTSIVSVKAWSAGARSTVASSVIGSRGRRRHRPAAVSPAPCRRCRPGQPGARRPRSRPARRRPRRRSGCAWCRRPPAPAGRMPR